MNAGFGPGGIPLAEIATYADLMQIQPGDQREVFVRLIRRMDSAYLDFMRTKHERASQT